MYVGWADPYCLHMPSIITPSKVVGVAMSLNKSR
jgi:hypothetical protein